jgi:hypothetical protein
MSVNFRGKGDNLLENDRKKIFSVKIPASVAIKPCHGDTEYTEMKGVDH